jgi:hypothetical protein
MVGMSRADPDDEQDIVVLAMAMVTCLVFCLVTISFPGVAERMAAASHTLFAPVYFSAKGDTSETGLTWLSVSLS